MKGETKMCFEVGDMVKFKKGDYLPQSSRLTNLEYCTAFSHSLKGVYEVEIVDSYRIACKGIGWFLADRFELVEQPKQPKQPEPQVGDVWANADKSVVVKVVGKFKTDTEEEVFSFVHLKDWSFIKKGMVTSRVKLEFLERFPLFLHRPPKKQPKQPKVAKNQPKKREEEKWEQISGTGAERAFCKGNKIKWVTHGKYEGIATCNKKDEFNLQFGIALAWHRAKIKYHEARIAEMLKEDVCPTK